VAGVLFLMLLLRRFIRLAHAGETRETTAVSPEMQKIVAALFGEI